MFQSDAVSDDAVFINSIVDDDITVGSGSVLSHTHLPPGLKVGQDSIISGICSSDVSMPLMIEITIILTLVSRIKCYPVGCTIYLKLPDVNHD